ncbi:MAG: aminotransferase class V-fold PLP-dependent enzyme [Phaeodactylibacter sp.]|nr:aminotransferase class V-fold PLP-dependent enzyme [Phaeodactylibacter sp.]
MNTLIQQAYDPEAFRRAGHELIDLLAGHLTSVQARDGLPAIPFVSPEEEYAFWQKDYQENQCGSPSGLFQSILDRSIRVQHPRYMGHQISPAAPMAALASLVDGLLNNGMGVYEMGAAGTAIERLVVKAVAEKMGFGEAADGVLTSGGTLANLTALLAARSVRAPASVWREGHQDKLALLVSEEAHYCVDRAVRIMGWGEGGIIKVPADKQYRMRADLLEESLQQARADGKTVIAVVGSACSTSTGSFDDLEAIAGFCEQHGLWFHVDGAHGGALCFSSKHRPLLSGIERADSVVMDFHKMLLTPAVATALIFRNGQHSFRTFSQKAQYLWEKETDEEWHNLAKRTFECTKLMMGLKAYTLLRTYGPELWEQYLEQVMNLGRQFALLVRETEDFELAIEPSCNIVCFRYHPAGIEGEDINALNEAVRQGLLEEGRFYIVKTNLHGSTYLRVTLSNPFTTESDIRELLGTIEAIAKAGWTV